MKSLKIGRSRKDVKSLKIGRSSLPLAVKEVFSGAQTMVDVRCPDIKGHNDVVNVVKNQTNILNDTLSEINARRSASHNWQWGITSLTQKSKFEINSDLNAKPILVVDRPPMHELKMWIELD